MATTISPTSRLLLSVSRGETRPDIRTTSVLSETGEAEGTSSPGETTSSTRTPVFELLSGQFDPRGTRLSIDRDENSGRFVYRIVSRETGEILRQFPGEEVLRVARSLASGVGRVIDEQA